MTEREKVKKELRKAVREVFMKYKREGLWNSPGHYEYHKEYFRLAFSVKVKDAICYGGYVLFIYGGGTRIVLDKQQEFVMTRRDYKDLLNKIEGIIKEIDQATLFWRTFYKIKHY